MLEPDPETNPIPKTDALQQVSRLSIQDLFSRDPEAMTRAEFEAVIGHMQELRERLAASETIRQPRVKKEATSPAVQRVLVTASQLGLVKRPRP